MQKEEEEKRDKSKLLAEFAVLPPWLQSLCDGLASRGGGLADLHLIGEQPDLTRQVVDLIMLSGSVVNGLPIHVDSHHWSGCDDMLRHCQIDSWDDKVKHLHYQTLSTLFGWHSRLHLRQLHESSPVGVLSGLKLAGQEPADLVELACFAKTHRHLMEVGTPILGLVRHQEQTDKFKTRSFDVPVALVAKKPPEGSIEFMLGQVVLELKVGAIFGKDGHIRQVCGFTADGTLTRDGQIESGLRYLVKA